MGGPGVKTLAPKGTKTEDEVVFRWEELKVHFHLLCIVLIILTLSSATEENLGGLNHSGSRPKMTSLLHLINNTRD